MHHTSRRMGDARITGELEAFHKLAMETAKAEHQEFAAWVEASKDQWVEEYARSFSAEQRRKAAKEGAALPDGSFPIYSQEDANNAAALAGNGSAAKGRVVAHIRKRVRQLSLKMPPSLAPA